MATPIPNFFTSYDLSPREQAEGCQLNINQRMVIQNRLVAYATEKLNWLYNPEEHLQCIQREAELQGQIRLLQLMLDESDEATNQLLHMARDGS